MKPTLDDILSVAARVARANADVQQAKFFRAETADAIPLFRCRTKEGRVVWTTLDEAVRAGLDFDSA